MTGKSGWLCSLLCLLMAGSVLAAQPGEKTPAPVVSIIIDDMGLRLDRGQQVIDLPGPVVCSILPFTPYARKLAIHAHARNKEVMLHLPMQSVGNKRLGPGGLTMDMSRVRFVSELNRALASVPHVHGINNHMGSLLTRHPGHMLWLMQALSSRGNLFFIDSRTTSSTVALQLARENGVPSMKRDVFLDHDTSQAAINAQFDRLIVMARKNGSAIAIGHPYPETIAVLRKRLPELKQYGIRLISIRAMLALHRRKATWQASLSHSPRAVKSSKQ